ncbi:MAG: cyclase family protein, partial [Oscillospiraceae bacterium]
DFLALGTPANELPPVAHRALLGFDPKQKKFITCVEDMHLAELPKGGKIKHFFNSPLRIVDIDSSQVTCTAEI